MMPVTRIFLPERRPIAPIILSAVKSAFSVVLIVLAAMAQTAAADKVLRVTFQAAEAGFDPVKVSDYYSGSVIEAIFDPLLTYDYDARPAKLVPNTAAALPQVDDGGR